MKVATRTRRRGIIVRVRGTVQGVGFRPFVFRLAEGLGISGSVLNDDEGVIIEAEGSAEAVDRFVSCLSGDAPRLAVIESVEVREAPIDRQPEPGFRILDSRSSARPHSGVASDTATCEDCLAEIFDPSDRRFRYPFANCTNCGPRFTIQCGIPYDRPQSTMAGFGMCRACRAEYEDPRDRRFHAQPVACPDCGPKLRIVGSDRTGVGPVAEDPITAAAELLASGGIVAIKGLGGYHLACRADDERAVAELRRRKHREDRPFALMATDLDKARSLVDLTSADIDSLVSPARPIVIARRRRDARVAASVAPGSPDLGVMLAYTPLHHLLLAEDSLDGASLVMTSGNASDEPIAFTDDDALARLDSIADAFLIHDRPIHIRADDSVLRSVDPATHPRPLVIRRSRGLVPAAIKLPQHAPEPVLGCGAELKSTFCLADGDRAWVGHHIGDLRNWETLTSFRSGIEHFSRLFELTPTLVAHDLHPDYLSTVHAGEMPGVSTVGVQHHHAHLAACLAEHGETGAAVGAILDGAGLGTDGTVWGGEILLGDVAGFERVGMLFPVRLPGGDVAAREPWRMACSWLEAAFGSGMPAPDHLAEAAGPSRWEEVAELVRTGFGAPVTTSAGRLFDAAAALCDIRTHTSYEGQAAIELEAAACPGERRAYPMPLCQDPGSVDPFLLDARETLRALVSDIDTGVAPELVSARFHNGLAEAVGLACAEAAESAGTNTVALSGGVFQNRVLLERTSEFLRGRGLRPLIPTRLPANDGGISYGQVAVAVANRRAKESTNGI